MCSVSPRIREFLPGLVIKVIKDPLHFWRFCFYTICALTSLRVFSYLWVIGGCHLRAPFLASVAWKPESFCPRTVGAPGGWFRVAGVGEGLGARSAPPQRPVLDAVTSLHCVCLEVVFLNKLTYKFNWRPCAGDWSPAHGSGCVSCRMERPPLPSQTPLFSSCFLRGQAF